jgi:ribosomal peptide maturation radical SAM protein 1
LNVVKLFEQRPAPYAVLVSMPWTTLTEPSLGLGVLKAVLNAAGIRGRVRHLNLFALRFLQAKTYYALANVFALNDFLFSGVIDPELTPRQTRLLRAATKRLLSLGVIDAAEWGGEDGVIEQLLILRRETIPAWLDECADAIVNDGATFVGFTCMFDQTIASAALARLIKQRAPDILVALGGYAVRSPTAGTILDAFPWIDAICDGEGEPAIADLARSSTGEKALSEIPGLTIRDDRGAVVQTAAATLIDINSSPIPDYDDFFSDVAALQRDHRVEIEVERLPLENARGCWWGAKSHCIFCGIADSDMAFRAKHPDNVIRALDETSKRYGITAFRFSDYILPQTYYRTLLPLLASRPQKYTLTGEIKANVKPEWVDLLRDAGFTEVQPGIESLSDTVLQTMRKGVTATQNVHTMLLGKAAGVLVHYNLIYGFPDEDIDDYRRMIAVLPTLFHLDAPSTRLPVQITRYAPLQEAPERFGLPMATHDSSYGLIFGESFLQQSRFDLDRYCYYFERPFENAPQLRAAHREIDRIVDHWKSLHRTRDVILSYVDEGPKTRIVDTRGETALTYLLDAHDSAIIRALRTPQTIDALSAAIGLGAIGSGAIADALKRLSDRGLIFHSGAKMVSLPLPASTRWRHQTPMPEWSAVA